MAGVYRRRPLSGAAHGVGIKVAATATPGTIIHTAQADTTLVDVITLYAYNSDSVNRQLVLEWGGTTAPDNQMGFTLPPLSTVPVVVDLILRNTLIVRAFTLVTANVVSIHGFVNTET